jgi:hypothetical protein
MPGHDTALDLAQIATPAWSPASGRSQLYFKADGLLYRRNSAGTEAPVDTVGGAAPNNPVGTLIGGGGNTATLNTFIKIGAYSSQQLDGGMTVGSSDLVVPTTGWYQVSAYLRQDSVTSGRRIGLLYVNAAEAFRMGDDTGAYAMAFSGSNLLYLTASDALAIYMYQTVANSAFTNARLSAIYVHA